MPRLEGQTEPERPIHCPNCLCGMPTVINVHYSGFIAPSKEDAKRLTAMIKRELRRA